MTKTKLSSFRDFLWVIRAYLRGKVFRQKVYRPQPQGDYFIFRATPGANFRRTAMLINWWGHRSLTVKEFTALTMNQHVPEDDGNDDGDHDLRAPCLRLTNDGWKKSHESSWNNTHNLGIASARRF